MRATSIVGWFALVACGGAFAACGSNFESGDVAGNDGGASSNDGAQSADGDNDGAILIDGSKRDAGVVGDASTGDAGASDSGVDAGHASDGGNPTDAGNPVDAGNPIDSGVIDSGPLGDACTLAVANPAIGVFVSNGGQSGGCGSAGTPCNSIQAGINLASTAGKSIVYVDHGTYVESLNLISGIEIQGGWIDVGGTWTRQCSPTNASGTIVKAPASSNKTIVASSVTNVTIDTLTVASKDAANVGASESIYGIFSTSSNLTLVNVAVSVVGAGAGQTGGGGTNGAASGGGCSASDGQMGGTGGAGGVGTGTFGASGYTPGTGGTGATGATGHNGTPSSPPFTCVNGIECLENNTFDGCQSPAPTTQSCGTAGTSGCGGQPGTGSSGGAGGGSSVGVYVWGGTVTSAQGSFAAGNGGGGGNAGTAGSGGSGGTGAPGSNGFSPVVVSCKIVNTSQCQNNLTTAGGRAGGPGGGGGTGGTGGTGGGGAGGYSYSYFMGGGGSVIPSGTTTTFGTAGSGGSGGNNGPSGAAAAHN